MSTSAIVKNPWERITTSNRVLEEDLKVINKYNQKREINKVCLSDYPEPFLGNLNSEIYVLFGNPGHDKTESCDHNYTKYQEKLIFESLSHRNINAKYPNYFFDPKFKLHLGAIWSKARFMPLLKQIPTSPEKISQRIFCVELYGYHSYGGDINLYENLPSSTYVKYLVREAIGHKKVIFICRAVRKWYNLIPALADYEDCHIVASNRGISLSQTTISPTAFKKLRNILKPSEKKNR